MNLNKAQSLELAKALVKELKGKSNIFYIFNPRFKYRS